MRTRLGRPLAGERIHFVGIGGAGMAALAELALALDYEVSGSDLKESRVTRRLVERGAQVAIGAHHARNVGDADQVVVSAAVPASNAEVRAAQERGVSVISRAEMLGKVLDAGRGIAVAGTHGKTTTASMLAWALERSGLAPSFLIGGDLNDVGSGAHLGQSDIIVAEADEAYASFLQLRPHLAVVTNVDVDHLDHYADQDAIDHAFLSFLRRRRDGAHAVLCIDDAGVRRIIDRVEDPVVTYGHDASDLRVRSSEDGWRVWWHGEDIGRLTLTVPGHHNVLNASGALAATVLLGADPRAAVKALGEFGGVERRFSVRGVERDVVVVDDYAHNPRKVSAAISAAGEAYPGSRIIALFQPHLYSRTQQLADAFGRSFEGADVVVVTNVYGAREEPVPGVTGRLVVDAIRREGGERTVPVYIPPLEEAAGFVAGLAEPGDVVLTLGAGDVTTAAPRILELLRASGGRDR